MAQRESNKALWCAWRVNSRIVPDDLGGTRQVQEISACKIGEEESGARVTLDITEGIEEVIARVVGKDQRAPGLHVNEARPTSTMGDVPAAWLAIASCAVRRNEEGVCAIDQRPCDAIQACQRLVLCLDRSGPLKPSRVNVLGTVAERLHHLHVKSAGGCRYMSR